MKKLSATPKFKMGEEAWVCLANKVEKIHTNVIQESKNKDGQVYYRMYFQSNNSIVGWQEDEIFRTREEAGKEFIKNCQDSIKRGEKYVEEQIKGIKKEEEFLKKLIKKEQEFLKKRKVK